MPARDFKPEDCRMIRLGADRVQVHCENHRAAGEKKASAHLVLQSTKGGHARRVACDSPEARELVEDYPALRDLRVLESDREDDEDGE